MQGIIYSLCAITATLCAVMLLRAYSASRYRLLLWSGLCFAGMAVNNILLVVDKLVLLEVDLSGPRNVVGLVSMLVLLYGLIMDSE
jgi:hypothetical protein